jgi:transglutaminase-like putative cysteine protease
MTVPLLLRATVYGVVLNSFGALLLTEVLSPPVLGLVGGLMAASWFTDAIRGHIPNYRRLWDVITALFFGYTILDFLLLAESFIAAIVHLLLFLLVYKLFNARRNRDLLDVFILSFLMLVVASTLTTSLGFLAVFCGYMLLGIWGLLLFHLKRETDAAYPEKSHDLLAAPGLIPPRFLVSGLGVVGAALVLTLIIFFTIPRVGRSFLPFRGNLGSLVTGFTDRVDLGADGSIQSDPTIVMRVSFPDDPGAVRRYPDLKWRGVALSRFDGRAWTMADPERSPVRRTADGGFSVARHQVGRPFLAQEIFLEPIGSEAIFAAPRVVTLFGRFPGVTVDGNGGLTLPAIPQGRLRYLVISQPDGGREAAPSASSGSAPIPPEIRQRYLQLPPLAPRVRDLARRLVAGAVGPTDAAGRIERYLAETLRYSLEQRPGAAADPLDAFLFERQSGNCEYFAAAMAVLARAAGIPTRVVNGFQRGEWNEIGQYFAVRQRDAHSWVEAYVPERGWVVFDPSPRAAFEVQAFGDSGRLGQYFDALRMRWARYVVDYNLSDQTAFSLQIRQQSRVVRQNLGQAWEAWTLGLRHTLGGWWRDYGGAIGLGAALVAALLVLWRRRPGRSARAERRRGGRLTHAPVAFYERMLLILARRGFVRNPTATAREFMGSLADRPVLSGPAAEITTLYERVRFGGEPLTSTEQARARSLLEELAGLPR